jgi:hypothetical protein
MADVVGMSDVSSPDTGKGSQLKTGGGRRKHNMPSKEKCAKEWKKMNYKSMEDCMNYGKAKPQKAGTSAKEQQDKIGWDMAESKNWRMKRKLKRQAKSG